MFSYSGHGEPSGYSQYPYTHTGVLEEPFGTWTGVPASDPVEVTQQQIAASKQYNGNLTRSQHIHNDGAFRYGSTITPGNDMALHYPSTHYPPMQPYITSETGSFTLTPSSIGVTRGSASTSGRHVLGENPSSHYALTNLPSTSTAGLTLDNLAAESSRGISSTIRRPLGTYDTAILRPPGACARCKRLKMKCVFTPDAASCTRCACGNHECVVEGRKPRSPGMSDLLRKEIRDKQALVDQLLQKFNPTPTLATPLTIIPSRLALTDVQRNTYHEVLSWFERPQNAARAAGINQARIAVTEDDADDLSASGDDDEVDSEKKDDGSGGMAELESVASGLAPVSELAKAVLECNEKLAQEEHVSTDTDKAKEYKVESGIGNHAYFQTSPAANLEFRRVVVERQSAPDILLCGLVTPEDAIHLFDIYFKWMNPAMPILDENIHTPSAVLFRCPFLFTVVCSIASKFYDKKPGMHVIAYHLAKAAAANAFLGGWKTVEMCQAYILLAIFTPPAQRWEEDRHWFFTGIAYRLAIELNLNRIPAVQPSDERGERELLNRLRTWILCFIIDRCIGVNLGKPFMIPEDDLVRNASIRFRGFRYQSPGDIFLVSLVEILRLMAHFSDAMKSLAESKLTTRHEEALLALQKASEANLAAWKGNVEQRCEEQESTPDAVIQKAILMSMFNYCRLVTHYTGFHQMLRRDMLNKDDIFLSGCIESASNLLHVFLNDLKPTGVLPYSSEQMFFLSAFAAVILLMCLSPRFNDHISHTQKSEIAKVVDRFLTDMEDLQKKEKGRGSLGSERYTELLRDVYNARVPRDPPLAARTNHAQRSTESEHVYHTCTLPTDFAFTFQPPQPQSAASFTPQVSQPEYNNYHLQPQAQPRMDESFDPSTHQWQDVPTFNADDGTFSMPPLLGFADSNYLGSMLSATNYGNAGQSVGVQFQGSDATGSGNGVWGCD
ncbi:hypothetical protein K474DRAFT_134101 [Panus rudis PR-1116 ss-1]|nr:hypothetical protein K474DRAFT_134101 [Panus rudis PR-1116 ss-1]